MPISTVFSDEQHARAIDFQKSTAPKELNQVPWGQREHVSFQQAEQEFREQLGIHKYSHERQGSNSLSPIWHANFTSRSRLNLPLRLVSISR
ncbi:hypothetical protein WAI453_002316 [Rhynchosporium graminicola]